MSRPFARLSRMEAQRRAYEDVMGEEAAQRQVVARERARGCTCDEKLILANRTRNANAGHETGCPLSAESQFVY